MKNILILSIISISFLLPAMEYTPSPDYWEDQNIYFIMTDRFANGDRSNDDFGKGEFNPEHFGAYHGGDLQGIIDKLDYIKALGATAIWITPHIQNQWVSPKYGRSQYFGYHGYWAQDFYKVDPHLGTMDEYKKFVKAVHDKGMYVIQDIVCNHMGDFVSADGKNEALTGYPEKAAYPFDNKDLFHYNGTDIYETGFAGTLDDLKTEDQFVKDQLIAIFKFWISEADIDGYRIDTVKYVKMDFWKEFCKEIKDYAASLGKKDFLIFGEDYEYDDVKDFKYDEAEKKQGAYTGTDEEPIFNSMLDFVFSGIVTQTIAGASIAGGVTNDNPQYGSFKAFEKKYSITTQKYYTEESKNRLVTFIDNHDMSRFLYQAKADGDQKKLLLAVTLMYTLPGIPCLYYGTEQGFSQPWVKQDGAVTSNNRQDLWDSNYTTDTELFKSIAKIAEIRNSHTALRTGRYVSRIIDGNDGAIFSYSRIADGDEVVVIINRSMKRQKVTPVTDISGVLVNLLTGKKVGKTITMLPQSSMILKSF
ncbi:MAG: hypothetical protein A2015_06230 [Spirochaetes bacterium GWF1_31_7]|nr:MAG: hypothetical protein A2Y30_08055 [Spirochaetes bacterium GWE1_32_154]OHD51345.1 MAG: hypothetical protein A2Y29_14445 [Spirochaetes bacterium GWE2_31_10]OHD53071.1 MAG: hypothetical protein A2015_06230 [Spirochaetes bacterium GWF1_31_7]HBD95152.1 hypothetical protein [Spirochaetia bacterium]HBI36156.1 hypothetical protein [Spirochaetia bacterium]